MESHGILKVSKSTNTGGGGPSKDIRLYLYTCRGSFEKLGKPF